MTLSYARKQQDEYDWKTRPSRGVSVPCRRPGGFLEERIILRDLGSDSNCHEHEVDRASRHLLRRLIVSRLPGRRLAPAVEPHVSLVDTGADASVTYHARRTDLDVVRGFAIILAMGWHLNGTLTGVRAFDLLLYPGHYFGWVGVDIFFVLSGFLVGGMILRELDQTGNFNYGRFYVRRLWRLWPALYVFILVMLIVGHMGLADGWKIAAHVQNYFEPKMAHHLWSLAVEEHFYVLFSLLLPAISLFGVRGHRVAAVLLLIMISCFALRCLALTLGVTADQIFAQTQYRLDGLACGVLIAHIALFRPKQFAALTRLKGLWVVVSLATLTGLLIYGKATLVGSTIGLTASYIFGAAFLMLTYASGVERWAWPAAMGLAFLGRNAYTLYLFHVPVFKIVTRALVSKSSTGIEKVETIMLCYLASVVVAWLVSLLVERPFIRLREWLSPRAVG